MLSKILNEVSDEENDDIEDINSSASDDYKNFKDRIKISLAMYASPKLNTQARSIGTVYVNKFIVR